MPLPCAEHFHDCHREHPRRHQQYEKYFNEHDYKRMNFPVGYRDLEKFQKDNPNIVLKIYGATGVSKHTTKKELHQKMFPWYFPNTHTSITKRKEGSLYSLFVS